MFKHLRQFFDKLKPTFSKGGKFSWLESTFEAFETFAFTPNRVTRQGCHVRDAVDLKRAMITVVIATMIFETIGKIVRKRPPQSGVRPRTSV